MLEQLTQLAKQFGLDSVVKNTAIPNEHNDGVVNETSNSIMTELQNLVSKSGGVEQLAGLLNGKAPLDTSNPVVKQISDQLINNLGQKFGLSNIIASGVASSMIPQVLSGLINKANDPNDHSFHITDLVSAIAGGSSKGSGIMDTLSKLGLGNSQNNSGDGLSGILGKLFS